MEKVDARGLSCPEPVIKTKKALKKFNKSFQILLNQEVAKENVSRLIKNSGFDLSIENDGQDYILTVKKD